MDKNTGEEERRKIVKELGNYRRVVVCITVQDKEAGEYRSFFAGFRPQAPVVYAFFTSYRALASLEEAAAVRLLLSWHIPVRRICNAM